MEALVRKVKQQLALWPAWQSAHIIVLALSGGVDSIALLDIITRLLAMSSIPKRLVVAHYNHRLRPESSQESEKIAILVEQMGLEYVGGVWQNPASKNIEAAARQARYGFLAEVVVKYGAEVLLTAHHQDDAAETFLMKLVRGTSLKGLQGLRPNVALRLNTEQGQLVEVCLLRPLIHSSKQDIVAYAHQRELLYFEDSSNGEDSYTRNRYRHHYLPSLAQENHQVAKTLGQMQHMLHLSYQVHYQHFLEIESQIFMQSNLTEWTIYLPALHKLSKAEQSVYLTIFFEERFASELSHYHHSFIPALLEMMQQTHQPNASLSIDKGWICQRAYDYVYIRRQELNKPVQSFEQILTIENQWYTLDDGSQVALYRYVDFLAETPNATSQIYLALTGNEFPLSVRHRVNGDNIQLGNATKTYRKALRRLFIDGKIPAQQRQQLWVLTTHTNEIIWVEPNVVSQLYSHPQTGKITHVFLYQK